MTPFFFANIIIMTSPINEKLASLSKDERTRLYCDLVESWFENYTQDDVTTAVARILCVMGGLGAIRESTDWEIATEAVNERLQESMESNDISPIMRGAVVPAAVSFLLLEARARILAYKPTGAVIPPPDGDSFPP